MGRSTSRRTKECTRRVQRMMSTTQEVKMTEQHVANSARTRGGGDEVGMTQICLDKIDGGEIVGILKTGK